MVAFTSLSAVFSYGRDVVRIYRGMRQRNGESHTAYHCRKMTKDGGKNEEIHNEMRKKEEERNKMMDGNYMKTKI